MYIYDVEYVRGGQGGALTLEIGQNSSFWPWTSSTFVPPFTNLMS